MPKAVVAVRQAAFCAALSFGMISWRRPMTSGTIAEIKAPMTMLAISRTFEPDPVADVTNQRCTKKCTDTSDDPHMRAGCNAGIESPGDKINDKNKVRNEPSAVSADAA